MGNLAQTDGSSNDGKHYFIEPKQPLNDCKQPSSECKQRFIESKQPLSE